MKKIFLSSFIAGLMFCTQPSIANAADSKQAIANAATKILNTTYDHYNAKYKCWFVRGGQTDSTYCMQLASINPVQNQDGTIDYYMLADGTVTDEKTGREGGYHAAGGLVGMFVFRLTPNGYRLIAQLAQEEIGSMGGSNVNSFFNFNNHYFGWELQGGGTWQGYSGSGASFYVFQNSNINNVGYINLYYSDEGAVEEKESSTLEGKIIGLIPNSDESWNDMPSIKIKVNGNKGKTKYVNKTYVIPFNFEEGKYILPKDYPIPIP